jgi:hypothetical protein
MPGTYVQDPSETASAIYPHTHIQGALVICDQCGASMQEAALVKHTLRAHDQIHQRSKRRKVLEESRRQPVLYQTSIPGNVMVTCLVDLCEGQAKTCDGLQTHFASCHPRDIIFQYTLRKRDLCHFHDVADVTCLFLTLFCTQCIQVPRGARKERTRSKRDTWSWKTLLCRRRCLLLMEYHFRMWIASSIWGALLLLMTDSDMPAVLNNIHKAHGCWAQVAHVLA